MRLKIIALLLIVAILAALSGYALADGTGYWSSCSQFGHSLECSFFQRTPYRRPSAYFTLTCTLGTAINGTGTYRYDCRIQTDYYGYPAGDR